MNAEVDRLLKPGFIQEVHHSKWLSNAIIVKIKNRKWRVCVDFTDLNRSCLTNPFPLHVINQLLDSMYRCSMFSFFFMLILVKKQN